ncbi:diacylglycerol kinase family protein [Paenibacillus thailandensis]|jgi:diacylglycerol kinase|uniref:Diacylglycerol kinase family protein n=1 Tax=Paenibacillus thailandensis TaxID=393250 RepID=A0ABW5QZ26_9BACL
MKRFGRSFRYACEGVAYGLRTQRHMRFHLSAAAVAAAVGLIVRIGLLEWALLLLTMAGVIAAELINTAIEKAVDLASPAVHPLAKAAKDTAAGAVLVLAVAAAAVGLIILGPPLWELIF